MKTPKPEVIEKPVVLTHLLYGDMHLALNENLQKIESIQAAVSVLYPELSKGFFYLQIGSVLVVKEAIIPDGFTLYELK